MADVTGNGDRKPRILLVEDNPGDVDLIRLAFKTAGLDCVLTVMSDGGEALAFINEEGVYAGAPVPDLAILDLNVPKNDGLEILEAMRSSSKFSGLPVAVLSSSSSPRDRFNVERFQIRQFVTKPSNLDEFLKIGNIVKDLLKDAT
jgi:DNA-binding response OmpR family regulator